MVRPYAVKGKKRKQKEKYDADDVEETKQPKQLKAEEDIPREGAGEDHVTQSGEAEENCAIHELEGIPIAPVQNESLKNSDVTFVLDKASLEVAKVGETYQT